MNVDADSPSIEKALNCDLTNASSATLAKVNLDENTADENDPIMQDGIETAQKMLGKERMDRLVREKLNGNVILVFTSDCCNNTTRFKDTITPFLKCPKKEHALAEFFRWGALQAVNPTDLKDIKQKLCQQATSLSMVVTPQSIISNNDEFEILATSGKKKTEKTDEGVTFAELGLTVGKKYGSILARVTLQYFAPHTFEHCDVAYSTISVTNYAMQRNMNAWSSNHDIAGIFKKTRGSGSIAKPEYVALPIYGKHCYSSNNTVDSTKIAVVIQHMREKMSPFSQQGVNGGLSKPLPVGLFTCDTLEIAIKRDPHWKGDWKSKLEFMATWLRVPPLLVSKL